MVPRLMRMRLTGAALCLFAFVGCTPAIGDPCTTAFNCSINGDRTCDLARPNGSCTIFGCEADACPDGAVCVRFRPDPTRLTFTACMRTCQVQGHCRVDEGYECVRAEDIVDADGSALAEVVDVDRADEGMFCAATTPGS